MSGFVRFFLIIAAISLFFVFPSYGQQSCDTTLVVYSGLTINNDGLNDGWIIDGIEQCPDNHVAIYGRSGQLIWEADGYDNDLVMWKGKNMNDQQIPDGTYFYSIKRSSGTLRGWVFIKS